MADKNVRSPRIVAIGGGTGLSTILRGLKHVSPNLTAVVAMADNGGGSVELHIDQANRLTTKTTVKLNVFLEGNNTEKPDKVLSVSVKFI